MQNDPRLLKLLYVDDGWHDVNEMLGIPLDHPSAVRGQGHTSHQMLMAPQGAYFVWVTRNLDYPTALARHLGRPDLRIKSSSWIEYGKWVQDTRGHRDARIVIDHAFGQPTAY